MPCDLRFSFAERDRSCPPRPAVADAVRTQCGPARVPRNGQHLGSISGAWSRRVAKETVEHPMWVQAGPTRVDPHQQPFRVVEVPAEHEPDAPRLQLLVDGMEPAADHLVLLVGDPELLPALKPVLLGPPVLDRHSPGALCLDVPDHLLVGDPKLDQQLAGRRPRVLKKASR
jgi:hypothetical protein